MRRLLCLLLALWVAVSLSPAFGASKLLMFGIGGIKPLVSYDLTASNTLPAGISYSATSLRTVLDSNGFITYAPNNLLLQSNTFSNGVAWAPTAVTLTSGQTDPNGGTSAWRLQGTGTWKLSQSITASVSNAILVFWVKSNTGSSQKFRLGGQTNSTADLTATTSWQPFDLLDKTTGSAGQLAITRDGASDNVDLLIYAAAYSAVTYETSPRPGDQVITTSSAYYGPAFDSNYPSAGYQGLRIWEQYTNVDLWNRDLTNAAWTVSNVTAAHNQTGIDGVANSASSITATANNGTICQAITLASSKRQQAIYVERLTGTGAVSLSMDGGATYTALTVTASWGHQSIPAQTLANPQTCIKLATSGDSVAIDGVQNDNASAALAPVAFTASTAVSVSADIAQATGALAACYKAASMSAMAEFNFNNPAANQPAMFGPTSNLRNMFVTSSSFAATYNGSVILRSSTAVGTKVRQGISYTPSGRSVVVNGGGLTSDTNTGASGATVWLGSGAGTSNFIDGYIRKIACWSPALPNSILQQKSVVGPGPITWLIPANDNFAIDERRKAV